VINRFGNFLFGVALLVGLVVFICIGILALMQPDVCLTHFESHVFRYVAVGWLALTATAFTLTQVHPRRRR
jgi:hypothetical protein